MLYDKGVKHLILSWTKRPIDETFTLQMNDESNYFRNKYMGPLSTCTIADLYRNTEYQFRVSNAGCPATSKLPRAGRFLSSWPHIIKKDRAIIRRSPSIERYPIDPIHLPNRESKGRFRQHNVGLFGVSGLDERLLTRETGLIHLDPPRDNGGADIQQYHLELEEPKGKQCAPIDSSDWFRFSFILH